MLIPPTGIMRAMCSDEHEQALLGRLNRIEGQVRGVNRMVPVLATSIRKVLVGSLIAVPLILIYRRFYGLALTLRLVALLWLAMAAAGLVVELLFVAASLVPTTRPTRVVEPGVGWNATTFGNIVALGVFAVLYWLHRNRERLGGGAAYAIDPVCGMQVERALAPARLERDGRVSYFCSGRRHERSAGAVRGEIGGR